jgi:hypothetical protein
MASGIYAQMFVIDVKPNFDSFAVVSLASRAQAFDFA